MNIEQHPVTGGVVDTITGEMGAGSKPVLICDVCGAPITDLGEAITLDPMEPGRPIKVVHHSKEQDCDPGHTDEYPGWWGFLDMLGALLWNYCQAYEGKEHIMPHTGTARVTYDKRTKTFHIPTWGFRISIRSLR